MANYQFTVPSFTLLVPKTITQFLCLHILHLFICAFSPPASSTLTPDGLTVFRQKIFKIDDHMAIGISGLTADARVLADYMRNERLFEAAMCGDRGDAERCGMQRAYKGAIFGVEITGNHGKSWSVTNFTSNWDGCRREPMNARVSMTRG